MSLDYPLYEEMVRRKSRAAPWWRVGDTLFYIGLWTAILSIPAGIRHVLLSGSNHIMLWYILAFVLGVLIYFASHWLKYRSYQIAKEDGIDPSKY
jgi:hypothetical protein